MTSSTRLAAFTDQFDFAADRLIARVDGPVFNSGNGFDIDCPLMSDDEYLWEPVQGCWSVRPHNGPLGARATYLSGSGAWGRDAAEFPHPWPPPFTNIAWRMSHLSELLALRADHTSGARTATREEYEIAGTTAAAVTALRNSVTAWRGTLTSVQEGDLDTVGFSQYPHGSDPDVPFLYIVAWVNQEVLAHGAEIALLRDLYRESRHR